MVPFNIASYALLIHILADLSNLVPGELIWNGKDIHFYENHQEQVDEALSRNPLSLPILTRSTKYYEALNQYRIDNNFDNFINSIEICDFELHDYNSHDAIKAPLSVGL